ncbi:MAG: hypothetical protein IJA91_06235 [Clostridia bacterium]|nr:hypothetical protein [Clostridia bacterium]
MSPSTDNRRYRFSIIRILLCSVLLSALVAVSLYVYHTAFTFYHARLIEDESKTFAWFTKQIGFSLPFVLICLFQYMVYHKHDRRDGVARREMFWEVVMVTVLTYGALLPYLSGISEALYINALAAGVEIPKTDGKVEMTLLMELHEWFIRLTIPLAALMGFHAFRARRESRFPESEIPSEPLMTVEEYEARRAAVAQAEALAAKEANDSRSDVAAESAIKESEGATCE